MDKTFVISTPFDCSLATRNPHSDYTQYTLHTTKRQAGYHQTSRPD